MTVTIAFKSKDSTRDVVIFRWDLTSEQLEKLNDLANKLVEENQ